MINVWRRRRVQRWYVIYESDGITCFISLGRTAVGRDRRLLSATTRAAQLRDLVCNMSGEAPDLERQPARRVVVHIGEHLKAATAPLNLLSLGNILLASEVREGNKEGVLYFGCRQYKRFAASR